MREEGFGKGGVRVASDGSGDWSGVVACWVGDCFGPAAHRGPEGLAMTITEDLSAGRASQ